MNRQSVIFITNINGKNKLYNNKDCKLNEPITI